MTTTTAAVSAPTGAGPRQVPPQLPPEAQQEIRIAAALNGGVSLAVWMSGAVLELHHVALSSQGVDGWASYGEVLDLLGATARIDVIAGTSAGGLNGAFLGLALAHRRDLALLRDLWTDVGSLEAMLRPGMEKDPTSLLRGDQYFLPHITTALRKTVSDIENRRLPSGADSVPAGAGAGQATGTRRVADQPIELILTGTLWDGRETSFTDDMGVGVTERDHDALFRFRRAGGQAGAGNLDDTVAVVNQLAHAARCTSSFPGAFEPHWVETEEPVAADRTWPSNAGHANFQTSQYVVDGGVLLNKPLRPALEAVYRQTGDRQVRRVLAYLVPSPGEPSKEEVAAARAAAAAVKAPPSPLAGEVLLGVLTRLQSSDSVARELAEIRDRSAAVRSRRRARGALSQALVLAAGMAEALWSEYRTERTRSAAATISRLITSGQPAGAGGWSEREIADALGRYAATKGFTFVPAEGTLAAALAETGNDWHWGQTTVGRLGDMTVDFLKRVVWFAPLDSDGTMLEAIVGCRAEVAAVLKNIRADRASLDEFWIGAATGASTSLPPIPRRETREGRSNQSATNLDDLDQWLSEVVPAWDARPSPDPGTEAVGDATAGTSGSTRRARMHGEAMSLAAILSAHREEIQRVIDSPNPLVDPSGVELAELRALNLWFFGGSQGVGVLEQMLCLDVVHVATAGATAQVEQEVELVQVSCSDPVLITGMQLHHFGAFYRAPWRVNDWIEGRLDGAKQIMRLLLSPERLRQRGYDSDDLYDYLHAIAVPEGSHEDFLEARWAANAATYRAEIDRVVRGTTTATALDEIADAVSMPVRLAALAEDLPALARAIRGEGSDTVDGSRRWLASYYARMAAASRSTGTDTPAQTELAAADLWALREEMHMIGSQTIAGDVGSDTFARTVSHAATVTAGLLAPPRKLAKASAVRFTLSTVRGYTAMLWTMVSLLTRPSNFGTHVVQIGVAVGGVLLAVTLLVPGVPLGLTLVGALLLFAGVTAASLLTPGGRWFAARVSVAAVLVAVALGYVVWSDVHDHGWSDSAMPQTLIKVAVGLGIVLLGAFVAQARPSKE
jgi:patatin-related protein